MFDQRLPDLVVQEAIITIDHVTQKPCLIQLNGVTLDDKSTWINLNVSNLHIIRYNFTDLHIIRYSFTEDD